MRRHFSLEAFSRDHNDALILVRCLIRADSDAIEKAKKEWESEMADHFIQEERILIPYASPDHAIRLIDEHHSLRQRFLNLDETISPDEITSLGHQLEAHIRWEERELYPHIESLISEDQAAELTRLAHEMERQRWTQQPRRERLVRQRWQKLGLPDQGGQE